MEVVTSMSEQEKEDTSNTLSLEATIGIAVGGFVLVLILVLLLICKVRSRKTQRTSGIEFDSKKLRTLSVKQNTLPMSYRRSDEECQGRPTSDESQGSYQFDANYLTSRDNSGCPSHMYDSPYMTIQRDDPEVQEISATYEDTHIVEMRRKNLNQTNNQVSIISKAHSTVLTHE